MKKRVILSLFIPIILYLICYLFVELEAIISAYFRLYYNPGFSILLNAIQVIVWAAILRIAMAWLRKPFYKGPLHLSRPALISACVFGLIYIINIILQQTDILFYGIFSIMTIFSILCVFQRKKE